MQLGNPEVMMKLTFLAWIVLLLPVVVLSSHDGIGIHIIDNSSISIFTNLR